MVRFHSLRSHRNGDDPLVVWRSAPLHEQKQSSPATKEMFYEVEKE